MTPKRSNRRVHSPEFKALVLGQCKQPGASVAAVAIAHGLNPNVVHKWLTGRNLKRMGATVPTIAPHAPALQFIPVELTKSEHLLASVPTSQPDIRIEIEYVGLQLKLRCAAGAAGVYAAVLRAVADVMAVA